MMTFDDDIGFSGKDGVGNLLRIDRISPCRFSGYSLISAFSPVGAGTFMYVTVTPNYG